jgi:hypothetical protein
MRRAFVFVGPFALIALTSFSTLSQFSLRPFSVDSSPLTVELKSLKNSKPDITPDEFAAAANDLLEKYGLGYTFYLDKATCDRVETAFAGKKPGDPQPILKANLNSVGGEKASLLLPAPDLMACARCPVTLPILQVTPTDFITKVSERNIKFLLPPEFGSDEVHLLDPKDPVKILKSWRIPFKGTPLGVLYDENAIYLSFPEPELSGLSLLVFEDGTFQFATRKEAESNGKSSAFDAGKAKQAGYIYLLFQNRDKKQVVGFPKSCK